MRAERAGQYFHSFETDVLPRVTWEEMLTGKVVFAPHLVLAALSDAEKFLTTTPGPNLDTRKVLAPDWFGYWKILLEKHTTQSNEVLIPSGDKLVKFSHLSYLLYSKHRNQNTGMLFVAGGEGHQGHVHAARYMKKVVPVTIWGFECPEYMARKERKAPFLPLSLRLSMWFYETSINYLTVLPGNDTDDDDNTHYNDLFTRSGAKYFFVHEIDPHLEEKLARGGQGLSRTISHPYSDLSTTDGVRKLEPEMSIEGIRHLYTLSNSRIIPHLPTESTTGRVQRLRPDRKDDFEELQSVVKHNFGDSQSQDINYEETFTI